MNTFLTGSRAYGKPTPKSDIDLVVVTDERTRHLLTRWSEDKTSVRYGKLNLILPESEEEAAIWLVVTKSLEKLKHVEGPVDKKRAKAALDVLRGMLEVEDRAESGHG